MNTERSSCKIEDIDNTPKIPDLTFESKDYSVSQSISESYEDIDTAKALALGPHKCRANPRMSNGEKICKQAIEDIYGVPFYCVRPDFLKNPETGRNLEIDIYNDQLKIGVEYSGEHHFVFPNTFHKTYEDFISQIRRDHYKIDVCDANGIYLITVPYNVKQDYDTIKKYIEYYLPENSEMRKIKLDQ